MDAVTNLTQLQGLRTEELIVLEFASSHADPFPLQPGSALSKCARRSTARRRAEAAFTVVVFTTLLGLPRLAYAQQSAPAHHRVAIVDVAYLLERLPAIREHNRHVRTKKKVSETERAAKMNALRQAVANLKELNTGSPGFEQQENRVAKLEAELRMPRIYHDTSQTGTRSEVYLDEYRKVSSAVEAVALKHDIHLVLNVNREEMELRQSDVNSSNVMRNVVFHDHSIDITNIVLRSLLQKEAKPSPARQ